MAVIDEGLIPYATRRQIEFIEATNRLGKMADAERELGVSHGVLSRSMGRLARAAEARGYAPEYGMVHPVPGSFRVAKVSTYHKATATSPAAWVQAKLCGRGQDDIEEMARHVVADVQGMSPLRKGPLLASSSLMATYWFGDPHFGLGSSSEDGGDNTDIDDADRLTRSGVDALVSRMPATKRAIFGFIGDNTHANDSSALTPGGKNALDVDVRGFGAAFLSVSRAICYAITRGLEKHDEIEGWVLPGNHDPDAAFGIAVAVSMFFDNNPRVTIRLSRDYLWWTVFGRNLIAAHHGDKIKPMDLHGVLSNDCKEVWAGIDFRYVFQGHIHHDTVTEYQQTRFESLRTLSKQDAWHRGKGLRSMRDTRAVLYHERYGEAERYTVSAAMLEDALAA